jgi:hypothetical protein
VKSNFEFKARFQRGEGPARSVLLATEVLRTRYAGGGVFDAEGSAATRVAVRPSKPKGPIVVRCSAERLI